MDCPNCKMATRVVDVKYLKDHVLRRRKCICCGYHFYTAEIASEEAAEEMRESYRAIYKAKKKGDRRKSRRSGNEMSGM